MTESNPPQANFAAKPPLTGWARVTIACAAFTLLHAGTLLVAGYVWVFSGRKFPPFAHYEHGVMLFAALAAGWLFLTLMVSVRPAVDGWRERVKR